MTDMSDFALRDLVAHISAHPVTGSPADMRRAFSALAGPQLDLTRKTIGGVPCAVSGDGAMTLLWLHGGGYVFGGIDSHSASAAFLAKAADAKVILPDYPLAPEAIWPEQLTAVTDLVDALTGPIHVVGDSAGGHLALNLAFARPRRVTSLSLISPNTDRTGASRTRQVNSDRDPMCDDAQDQALAEMVFHDLEPEDPQVSPLFGPLETLPPVFLTYATNEVLADDSRLLCEAATMARVDVRASVEHGLPHMWTLWPDRLPQASDTLHRIAAFVTEQHTRSETRQPVDSV